MSATRRAGLGLLLGLLAALGPAAAPPRADWRATDARLAREDKRLLARLDEKQRQRLQQAQQWHAQVVRLYQQGKAKEALPLAHKVLETRREVLGQKHRQTAQSWLTLGVQLQALARRAEAE